MHAENEELRRQLAAVQKQLEQMRSTHQTEERRYNDALESARDKIARLEREASELRTAKEDADRLRVRLSETERQLRRSVPTAGKAGGSCDDAIKRAVAVAQQVCIAFTLPVLCETCSVCARTHIRVSAASTNVTVRRCHQEMKDSFDKVKRSFVTTYQKKLDGVMKERDRISKECDSLKSAHTKVRRRVLLQDWKVNKIFPMYAARQLTGDSVPA